MSPQPGTPCFDIITIPISLDGSGDGDDGFARVSRSDEWGKGDTSILQNVIWMSPRRAAIQEAFSNGYDFYV
jgi:hypothetical protein